MKINEITEEIVDEYSEKHPDIKKELKKKGYIRLGSGVDQEAYLEPGTGLVLKIFGTSSGTKGSGGQKISRNQKMFLVWAEFCMQHPQNKFLPKFYGFEKFVFNGHTYFQIRQERLTKMGKFGQSLWDMADFIKYDHPRFEPSKAFDEYVYGNEAGPKIVKELGEEDARKLFYTVQALQKIAKEKGFNLDLHDENWMWRDNTPVAIDPWFI